MEHGDYPLRLQEHLLTHGFRSETIANIGRMCRTSLVSEEKALELLEYVDADRKATDAEMIQLPLVTGTAGSLEWE